MEMNTQGWVTYPRGDNLDEQNGRDPEFSATIMGALLRRRGAMLAKVEATGPFLHHPMVSVASSIRPLWTVDAGTVFDIVARELAGELLDVWNPHPEVAQALKGTAMRDTMARAIQRALEHSKRGSELQHSTVASQRAAATCAAAALGRVPGWAFHPISKLRHAAESAAVVAFDEYACCQAWIAAEAIGRRQLYPSETHAHYVPAWRVAYRDAIADIDARLERRINSTHPPL